MVADKRFGIFVLKRVSLDPAFSGGQAKPPSIAYLRR